MRALVAERFDPAYRGLTVADRPRPVPAKGEVLVRVRCAAINPADLMTLAGTYIRETRPPFVPGVVGVGDVVENNGGLPGRLVDGKRVVFAAAYGKGGSWAEYAVADAKLCVALPKDLSDEAGVNLIANGATAVALASLLREGGHKAVVLTAAVGEVGRLLTREASAVGVKVVAVVRGQANVESARLNGAVVALDQTTSDIERLLAAEVKRFGATAGIDAVAGPMPALLMRALPDRATIWLMGRLSGEDVCFDAMRTLIARAQTLRGFAINDWFSGRNILAQLRAVGRARKLTQQDGGTRVRHRLSLERAVVDLSSIVQNSAGAGKTLIYPSRSDAELAQG